MENQGPVSPPEAKYFVDLLNRYGVNSNSMRCLLEKYLTALEKSGKMAQLLQGGKALEWEPLISQLPINYFTEVVLFCHEQFLYMLGPQSQCQHALTRIDVSCIFEKEKEERRQLENEMKYGIPAHNFEKKKAQSLEALIALENRETPEVRKKRKVEEVHDLISESLYSAAESVPKPTQKWTIEKIPLAFSPPASAVFKKMPWHFIHNGMLHLGYTATNDLFNFWTIDMTDFSSSDLSNIQGEWPRVHNQGNCDGCFFEGKFYLLTFSNVLHVLDLNSRCLSWAKFEIPINSTIAPPQMTGSSLLWDGKLCVFSLARNSLHFFDLKARTWSVASFHPGPRLCLRSCHTMQLYGDSLLLIMKADNCDLWRFDLRALVWEKMTTFGNRPHDFLTGPSYIIIQDHLISTSNQCKSIAHFTAPVSIAASLPSVPSTAPVSTVSITISPPATPSTAPVSATPSPPSFSITPSLPSPPSVPSATSNITYAASAAILTRAFLQARPPPSAQTVSNIAPPFAQAVSNNNNNNTPVPPAPQQAFINGAPAAPPPPQFVKLDNEILMLPLLSLREKPRRPALQLSRVARMFDDEYCNFFVLVMNEKEGKLLKTFRAHKSVVILQPFFAAVIREQAPNVPTHEPITITIYGVSPKIFNFALQFIYERLDLDALHDDLIVPLYLFASRIHEHRLMELLVDLVKQRQEQKA